MGLLFVLSVVFPIFASFLIEAIGCLYTGRESFKNPANYYLTTEQASRNGKSFNEAATTRVRFKAAIGNGIFMGVWAVIISFVILFYIFDKGLF
jgi:hypothetical protein